MCGINVWVECIIDYHVKNSNYCGGTPIREWDDGSNAHWGKLKGISDCKNECNKHIECSGFDDKISTGVCGNWMRAPLKLQHLNNNGINCYTKQSRKKQFLASAESTKPTEKILMPPGKNYSI